MVIEWQKRRSEFNHDWLKNRYLNNIDGFIANLQMKKPNGPRLMEFLEEDWTQWENKQKEAKLLLDTFEKDMSPAILFESGILQSINSETMEWLKPLTHYLWVERYCIKTKIKKCEEWLLKVIAQYDKINKMLVEKRHNIERIKSMLPEYNSFRVICQFFSESINKLPSEIIV